jgi:ABC-type sugar transport system ATPase subunit
VRTGGLTAARPRDGDVPATPLISCRNISKSFKGVKALTGVDFDVLPGIVQGLIGENGAGKSTLMKIISGVFPSDGGDLLMEGTPVRFAGTRDAISRRIVTIYQESDLIPTLTVAENVFLNQELTRGVLPFVNRGRQRAETRALLERFGLDIDPTALVRGLPMDVQKMIQIIKAVSKDARVLLMDEPTSSLTSSEVDLLLSFMHGLTGRGVGVVFISHYLPEVFRVCDRITILREGTVVRSVAREDTSLDETIRAMIGRTIQAEEARSRAPGTREVFAVSGLSVRRRLSDVSLEVHEGEVLGITGLIGSGTTELAKAMFRSEDVTVDSGEYRLEGVPVSLSGTASAVRHAMAFVPNDRKTEGLFNRFSVMDNICMAGVDRYAGPLGLLDRRRMRDAGTRYIEALAIKTPGTDTPVENLSGGNQQKVLLAKWLATEPQVLILDEPTVGIDVGTKFEIRRLIRGIADRGVGVILITSEIEELEKLCNRVLVLFRGRIVRTFDGAEITKESILKASMGET